VVWDGAAFLDFSGNNNDTTNQWVFRNGGTFRISSANAWKTTSNGKVEASSTTFTFELAAADLSINTTNMLLNNSGTAGLRFAALNANRTVTWTGGTVGGAATAINWSSTAGIGETLAFGNANATHKLTWASGINLDGGAALVTRKVDAINGSAAVGGEISGIISDNGTVKATLEKTGTGTLILSNANTYAGNTSVTGGTLLINGSTSTSSLVTVSSGATLGGSGGTVGGNTSVGGTLAPGSSIGTLNFTNALALNAGSTYLFELNNTSTTADLTNVGGTLTFDLTGLGVALDLVQLGTYAVGDKFTLFGYNSGSPLTGNFAGLANGAQFTDAGGLWQINYLDTSAGSNGGTGDRFVTITAVPEPSSFAMLAFGLVVFAWFRKQKDSPVNGTTATDFRLMSDS
jgi:autotransporter-associated beta strand protein